MLLAVTGIGIHETDRPPQQGEASTDLLREEDHVPVIDVLRRGPAEELPVDGPSRRRSPSGSGSCPVAGSKPGNSGLAGLRDAQAGGGDVPGEAAEGEGHVVGVIDPDHARVLDAAVGITDHLRAEDGLVGNVPEMDAVRAFQQAHVAVVRAQRTGGPLVQVKPSVFVEHTGVVGIAHPPVPLAGPDDRIFGAAGNSNGHFIIPFNKDCFFDSCYVSRDLPVNSASAAALLNQRTARQFLLLPDR